MDKIFVNQMAFYGYHGVFSEEKDLGQKFIVDVVLEADFSRAGATDNLNDTVNYAEVYQLTKEMVEGEPFNLIEALADRIASQILSRFHMVQTCHVKVIKPDPPIPGYYESVAVEVCRGRDDE
ncbi:dihydroneopterin aldolase [Tuberibacillus sp. Marseille-P3662]|uniref:dihydroneopterin aldolase n=1 Tax=Tuberibacillus sp. Marseille-P3662 TaxID=1965358 RepID=UPI000A1CBF21|nr:dihydroneopterin aldolase [Tuberibacillus sp. Marseille-P3662]